MQLLGASFDSVQANQTFAESNQFPFPLLCDTERVLGQAYGAGESGSARRISYVIDEAGVIEHVFDRVSSSTHAKEVLARLS